MARGFEVVADALVGAGVTDLFGVTGEGNLELVTHLQTHRGVSYHAMRHEAGALGAAHGYAQASGNLGVATVTHGPGFTNTLTALVSAVHVRAPVLLVVGDTATDADYHVQRTDHAAWVRAAGAVLEQAKSADTLPRAVDRAIHHAIHTSSCVVLLAPVDVLEHSTDIPALPPRSVTRPTALAPPGDVAKAIAAIAAAERPLVLAGLGAGSARAAQALIEIAETIGAELATTLRTRGLFDGHPLNVGTVGGYGHELAVEPCAEADLVLAFGASLNVFTTSVGQSFSDATIVQCDIDRAAFGATTRTDIELLGDAADVAGQLLGGLEGPPVGAAARRAVREKRIAGWQPAVVPTTGPPFHPAAVCQVLDQVLPDRRILALDAGAFGEYPLKWFGGSDPWGLVFTQGFGAVGLGMAGAIGAAVARPDRLCVVFVGDGGFAMSLPQYETAARLALPMVVVVMDDAAFGAEVHHLRRRGLPLDAAVFDNPDFAAVAEALGGSGMTVENLDQLAEVGTRVDQGLPGPLLVHARIDGDIVSPWFSGLVGHATRFLDP